jgi:predicted nucleic acid-binding protein
VLECALIGNASYSITGDHHLLEIEEYQGIVILPRQLYRFLNLGRRNQIRVFK